jgi:hypothetical protein
LKIPENDFDIRMLEPFYFYVELAIFIPFLTVYFHVFFTFRFYLVT